MMLTAAELEAIVERACTAAVERARHKEAGRVAVTVHIYPGDREKLARYIKRLNERANRIAAAFRHGR